MNRKWDAIRGNIGFFVTMAVCLLVVAFCGYFLLFDGDEPTAEVQTPPIVDTPVSAQTSEIQIPVEEEPPVVEPTEEVVVIAPPAQEVSAPMPEIEVDDTPVIAEAPQLIVPPVEGEILTAFSVDQLVYNPTLEDWRIHDGIDISAEEGAPVLAAASGTVLAVSEDPLMGITVVLEHKDGYQSTYANLKPEPAVEAGHAVAAGQIIGAVGTSAAAEAAQAPHLHFSVSREGDVVNPEEFLKS